MIVQAEEIKKKVIVFHIYLVMVGIPGRSVWESFFYGVRLGLRYCPASHAIIPAF